LTQGATSGDDFTAPLTGIHILVFLRLADTMPPNANDGVDITLIQWMLSLTPAERLDAIQGAADALQEVRAKDADWQFPLDPPNAG
jgi:hypothetical protein